MGVVSSPSSDRFRIASSTRRRARLEAVNAWVNCQPESAPVTASVPIRQHTHKPVRDHGRLTDAAGYGCVSIELEELRAQYS